MWMYFLFYLLVNSLLTANGNTTTNPFWTLAKTSNVSTKTLIEGTTSPLPNRQDYKRDVLLVLPVMQGNSELTNSNLQMLYTKTPLTTIIREKSANQASDISKRSTTGIKITKTSVTSSAAPVIPATSAPNITEILLEKSTMSEATLMKRDDYHHPYMEFLSTKTAPKAQKTPLDYGYPESFKFVQEMNDLPKNHKPEWAQSDLIETESKKSTTTESVTKKDPFQMFESVKPLEINKLLSLKPIVVSVTERVVEEITVKNKQERIGTSHPATKRPFNKRPTKKPLKVKGNPQKHNNAEFAPFIPFITMSTDKMITEFDQKSNVRNNQSSTPSNSPFPTVSIHSSTHMPVLQSSTIKLDSDLYSTARYSTFYAEPTKMFLPTPYSPPLDHAVVRPIQSESKFVKPSSENWLSIVNPITMTTAKTTTTRSKPSTTKISASSSTTTSTTFSSNYNRLNIKTPKLPIMEFSTSPKVIPEVKPADLISLTKILDEDFDKKHTLHALANSIPQTTTTKPHFPADMLTNDMKNMLITLGLLKPEKDSFSPLLLITSTTAPSNTKLQYHDSLYVQQEHLAPTIDPNSYFIFKKLPINYEKPQVSNDMQNFLSSFGLLPSAKSSHLGDNSILTRIPRQQKLENLDTTINMLDDKMQQMLENSYLMKPTVYQMNRKGHVFQPSMHLEKLTDPQQVEKVSNALKMIQMLSTSKDAQNLSIEELEKKLRNSTALLHEEKFLDGNATDMPQLTTELLSTMEDFIFYNKDTTVTKVESSSTNISNASYITTAKPLQTNRSLHTSPTTSNSTVKRETYSSISTTSSQSRRLRSSEITTTPIIPTTVSTALTISLITTSTPHFTVGSPSVATVASAKTSTIPFTTASLRSKPAISTSTKPTTISTKIELPSENSSSSSSTSSITPATTNLFLEEHNKINYTPDMSLISLIKLSHSKNNTKLIMPPPTNLLSIEELQHLLETNRNNVKHQQPQDVTTSSTTLSIVAEVTPNNVSSTTDISITSEISKNSSSRIRNATSSSGRYNSNNSNGSTEDSSSSNNTSHEALADSFGGEKEGQVDNWQANAKPNGLYFLLDWNTFLSVGEEDKRPIRIRFSPRAGNPRNFMPITVP